MRNMSVVMFFNSWIKSFPGYVCRREELSSNQCCDAKHGLVTRYVCESCLPNGCCSIYEHCVSCCLRPDKVCADVGCKRLPWLWNNNNDKKDDVNISTTSHITGGIRAFYSVCFRQCAVQSLKSVGLWNTESLKHHDKKPVFWVDMLCLNFPCKL